MSNLPNHWIVLESVNDLTNKTVQKILEVAEAAIEEKGRFDFVTAGGRTTAICYELLKNQSADWSRWHIFMGDERVLPIDDIERNSKTLVDAWLKHIDIPAENLHLMPTELGIEDSAQEYEKAVKGVRFDLTLLSIGEDGHTASLFPNHIYPENDWVVKEYDSPKPPSERISLSFKAIGQSQLVLKLISGAGKKEAVQKWLDGEMLPIAKATGQKEMVFITEDAL